MSDQLSLLDTPSAISSPASADGPSRSGSLAGLTIVTSGRARAHASLSARQAKELGFLTSGTFGLTSTGSLASARLQSFLESRLRARTASLGSTLYGLTWKPRATPSGRQICALRASVRRTSDSACSGWPTAAARDWKGATEERWGTNARPLNEVAVLAGWPTAVVNDATGSDYAYSQGNHDRITLKLGGTAKLAGWPTPTSSLADKGVRSTEGGIREAMRGHGPDLAAMACLAGPARRTVTGVLLTGSDAGMTGGGQLNPAHSRWLMGYMAEWDYYGAMATPSSRKSPRRSSKPAVSSNSIPTEDTHES